MGRVYQILTKWIFMLTLPLFSLMFLFPDATIRFFFGAKYVSAAPALQILALGFMFHTFLGLNGLSLLVIGKPKLNMIGDTFAVISNVLLNFLLIPPYGIVGAAVATAVSYFVANVFRSFWLYNETRIHPFSWNYVKPLAISFVLVGVIKGLNLRVASIWYAVPILVVFLGVYALLVLLSRSIDKEDVELLLAVEKRMGVDLEIIKRVLRKFV
ncbi:Polysaccharide biosynthesis protein (fragment) [Thermococcus camini]|uniref:Polysaccharide biosynthesis protein n=1 Tax=Thermococcus camini TaxID=2016373 RepID=A0A7G2D4H8_9EURY